MKRILFAAMFLPLLAEAQEPDTLAMRVSDPADSLASITVEGSFRSGLGAQVDTLDIGDGRLQIVLKDDHTWYYIKNLDVIAQDETFKDHWDEKALNAYALPRDSLPYHNTICLVDSASTFTCPYQRAVFSPFGVRRGKAHQGVDLPLPVGTPVKVAFDGRVRYSGYVSGYGNLMIVRHENGLETFYGHLSKRLYESGSWVRSGDVIGLGGSTGRSTGPHLHFETRYLGFAFDPQRLIDFENGTLRANVFVLRRSHLDATSSYLHESIDEEEEIYRTAEEIDAEEKRIAAEKAAMRWHTVKNGETLSGIAAKEGKSLTAIKNLNPGINVNKIRIGQKIRVN